MPSSSGRPADKRGCAAEACLEGARKQGKRRIAASQRHIAHAHLRIGEESLGALQPQLTVERLWRHTQMGVKEALKMPRGCPRSVGNIPDCEHILDVFL